MTTLKYAPYNLTGNLTTGNLSTGNVTSTSVTSNTLTSNTLTMAAAIENAVLVAAAPVAAQTIYASNGSLQYFTTAATTNWIPNFTYSSANTLNSVLSVGQTMTFAILVTNGYPAAYYSNTANIDGTNVGVTQYWQSNLIPTYGNTNGIDAYAYTIIKTSSTPTYTLLASQTQF